MSHGTLLDIDFEKFLFAYIDALSRKFVDYINPDDFATHLFGATTFMIENEDPSKINDTVFYEDFCRRIGYTQDQIKPITGDFYRHDFPSLSCWGKEHPHARTVVKAAQRKNLDLILATNPIFPATAILQRLSWSGLSEKISN